MGKSKEKEKTKESNSKVKTAEQFKKRNYSDVGTSVFEDLKKATDAEKAHRREREDKA